MNEKEKLYYLKGKMTICKKAFERIIRIYDDMSHTPSQPEALGCAKRMKDITIVTLDVLNESEEDNNG